MDPKIMFQKIAEIFSTGDTSLVSDIFSPHYVDHQRPKWMDETGVEEFKAIVKLARDDMPNLVVKVEGPIIADENMVAGRMLWKSDTKKRETIEMLKIVTGKFTEHWGTKSWSQDLDYSEK